MCINWFGHFNYKRNSARDDYAQNARLRVEPGNGAMRPVHSTAAVRSAIQRPKSHLSTV